MNLDKIDLHQICATMGLFLWCFIDDELPEYIMVMLANKRTKEQMIEDLNLFLNDEAETFVSW